MASKSFQKAVAESTSLWTSITYDTLVGSIVKRELDAPHTGSGVTLNLGTSDALKCRKAFEAILSQHGRQCKNLVLAGTSEQETPEHMLCGLMSEGCLSNLEELDVSYCKHLSVSLVCQLVRYCRKLRVLRARGAGGLFCTEHEMPFILTLPLAHQPQGIDALQSAVDTAGGGLSLEVLDLKGMAVSMSSAIDILIALINPRNCLGEAGAGARDSIGQVGRSFPTPSFPDHLPRGPSNSTPGSSFPTASCVAPHPGGGGASNGGHGSSFQSASAADQSRSGQLRSLSQGWISEVHSAESGLPGTTTMYIGNLAPSLEWLRSAGVAETLVKLDLSGTWHIGPTTMLEPFFASLANIKYLNLCSVPGLEGKLITLIPSTQIEHLNLRSAEWMDDLSLEKVLEKSGSTLKKLNISCADKLTTQSLKALPLYCPGLQSLDICFCMNMNMECLLSALQGLPDMRELGISGVSGTSDEAVLQILKQYGPRLTMLGVGGCYNLSDITIKNIAYMCPVLETLYAAGLHKVTDTSVMDLITLSSGAQARGSLRALCLDNCTAISDSLAAEIALRWPYTYDGDTMLGRDD
eukprot:gene22021-29081_t